MTYRVIVTGERDWLNASVVIAKLAHLRAMILPNSSLVIVHGACETGADFFAKRWAEDNGVEQDPHPAKWKGSTGHTEMAAKGADLCLAFWSGKTERSGTLNMITEATKHGIPVRIIPKATK